MTIKPRWAQKLPGLLCHGAPVQKGTAHALTAQKNVLHAVFKIIQCQVLIHGADSKVHGLGDGETAIAASTDPDLPPVGPEVAGEDFDQGGLTGAVIPHDSGDSPLLYLQGDAVKNLDLPKRLKNLVNGKDTLFHIHIRYTD